MLYFRPVLTQGNNATTTYSVRKKAQRVAILVPHSEEWRVFVWMQNEKSAKNRDFIAYSAIKIQSQPPRRNPLHIAAKLSPMIVETFL